MKPVLFTIFFLASFAIPLPMNYGYNPMMMNPMMNPMMMGMMNPMMNPMMMGMMNPMMMGMMGMMNPMMMGMMNPMMMGMMNPYNAFSATPWNQAMTQMPYVANAMHQYAPMSMFGGYMGSNVGQPQTNQQPQVATQEATTPPGTTQPTPKRMRERKLNLKNVDPVEVNKYLDMTFNLLKENQSTSSKIKSE